MNRLEPRNTHLTKGRMENTSMPRAMLTVCVLSSIGENVSRWCWNIDSASIPSASFKSAMKGDVGTEDSATCLPCLEVLTCSGFHPRNAGEECPHRHTDGVGARCRLTRVQTR